MAGPYTLADWNQLIDKINNILQNPPANTQCTPLPPLQHVTDPHLWSWPDDVKNAQTWLKKICGETTFTDHTRWEQSIIDEINAAIAAGWCGCLGNGVIKLTRYTTQPLSSNCYGTGDDADVDVDVASLALGLSLPHPPGTKVSGASLIAQAFLTNGEMYIAFSASCVVTDGTITQVYPDGNSPPPSVWPLHAYGIYVGCGDCNSQFCQESLAEGQAEGQSNIADSKVPAYYDVVVAYTVIQI